MDEQKTEQPIHLIVVKDGKVLCVQKKYQVGPKENLVLWTSIGDHSELKGITIQDRIADALHSVGLEVTDEPEFLGSVSDLYGVEKTLVYKCRSNIEPQLTPEFIKFEWFSPEEIPTLYYSEQALKLVKQYFRIHTITQKISQSYFSYQAWKYYETARNSNAVGQESAEKFVNSLKIYNSLFPSIILGFVFNFVLDLCSFFDRDYRTLSLLKIINYIEMPDDLRANINKKLRSHDHTLSRLRTLRDTSLAHYDIVASRDGGYQLIFKEIEDLYEEIKKTMNMICYNFNKSSFSWSVIEGEAERCMSLLIENATIGNEEKLKLYLKKNSPLIDNI